MKIDRWDTTEFFGKEGMDELVVKKEGDEMREARFDVSFRSLGRDLFWELVVLADDYPDSQHIHVVRWEGYDDAHWWKNVAPRARERLRRCACGQWFHIDFDLCEAQAVSEEAAREALAVDAVFGGELDDRPVWEARKMIEAILQSGTYEEIKARSEDEVPIKPGEVVIRGGSVIAGITREEE